MKYTYELTDQNTSNTLEQCQQLYTLTRQDYFIPDHAIRLNNPKKFLVIHQPNIPEFMPKTYCIGLWEDSVMYFCESEEEKDRVLNNINKIK